MIFFTQDILDLLLSRSKIINNPQERLSLDNKLYFTLHMICYFIPINARKYWINECVSELIHIIGDN